MEKSDTNCSDASAQRELHRHQFDAEFLDLQDPRNSSGRLIYVFIRRSLFAFHLRGSYTEACILNEAYVRGIRLIDQGQIIRNPAAWLRQTGYNIIRELHRDRARMCPFEEYLAELLPLPEVLERTQDDIATLRLAFQMLDSKDQDLLNLKIVQELSWKEIREALRLKGIGDCAEDVLRKRKERALIRLRKKFHSLKPPEELPLKQD